MSSIDSMPNRLTVIIPFLNEGAEVFHTVESIRKTSEQTHIILINDASTDGYDYRSVAETFGALYVEHAVRQGVAASRDEGVERCETPYFLLLDAHMRFYQNDWVDRIVRELDQDQRVVLCCQTVVLNKTAENTIIRKNTRSFGAYIDFSIHYLPATWNSFDPAPGSEVADIPCILGAGYALSKMYWQRLHGLKGLQSYGSDEQFLSMKTWFEGGRCKLLKEVKIGHIYREALPYGKTDVHKVFNHLLVQALFLPDAQREFYISRFRQAAPQQTAAALALLHNYASTIEAERHYYRSTFSTGRTIAGYVAYNRAVQQRSNSVRSQSPTAGAAGSTVKPPAY